MKQATLLLLVFGGFCGTAVATTPTAEQVEFFEKKIRPVLAQHCYECHNSLKKQEGGLALDYRDALLAGGETGPAIVPGKPEGSSLIWALRHEKGLKMPSKAPKLEDAVIQDFETWIAAGAPDPRLTKPTEEELTAKIPWEQVREQRSKWWSFQPLVDMPPPVVDNEEWSETPIDRFLFDRLQREGLQPQPEAAPEVLVRRLHLILTGLPPKPEEVKAFVDDPSPAAYEKLVDELLASKAFGERWARHWMDWYRYAESHGSEGDPRIPFAEQYRDYLIRALNADVPYDQLLREAIAGDLLAEPRINEELALNESAIGPAHLRMVPHGFGVTDAYSEQIAFTDNQIDVISKAMLGVTVSCARCHDHKFDPISQQDFYRFYGVMIACRPSTVLIDAPEKLATGQAEILELKVELRRQLAEHWLTQVEALPEWLEKNAAILRNRRELGDPLAAWVLLSEGEPDSIPARVADMVEAALKLREANVRAIAEAEFYVDLRDPANMGRWNAVGNGAAAQVSPAGSFALRAEGDAAIRSIYPRGIYSHLVSEKHAAVFSTVDFEIRGAGTHVRAAGVDSQLRAPIRNYPLVQGLHPATGLNNEQLRWIPTQGKWKYWLGEKLHYELRTSRDTLPNAGNKDRSWFGLTEIYAGDRPPQAEGAPLVALVEDPAAITDRDSLAAAYVQTLRSCLLAWRDGGMTDRQAEFLDGLLQIGFLPNKLEQLPAPLKELVARYRELESRIPAPGRAPGVIEVGPVDQPLLVRGDPKQEGEPVARGFLEVFGGPPFGKNGSGRLELAERTIRPENTLKTRVLINRLWAYVFGRGISASTDNLGRLGSPPTHPELLDHLALDFERSGWSIKRALRQMVMSRAFRSSGQADAETRERDPQNELLSHFTPRRLDAEAIYDSLAFVAGGGQRAVYLPVIRNQLDPFLATFNAPVPVSTVSFRTNTNVPAQSLTMMNGEFVERSARAWAERIAKRTDLLTVEEKITAMFLEAFARAPSPEETRLLVAYMSGEAKGSEALEKLAGELRRAREDLAAAEQAREELLAPVRGKLQREFDRRNAEAEKEPVEAVDLKPIASWEFKEDTRDAIGQMHGELHGNARLEKGALVLEGGCLLTTPYSRPLGAKTLEVLVELDRLDQRGGGAMSVQTPDGRYFDAIVFAEKEAGKWLAGSDFFNRTEPLAGAEERDAAIRPVRIVLCYEANGTIRSYRNGVPYAEPYRKAELYSFAAGRAQATFGLRHGTGPTQGRMLTGRIHEARLYDRALTAEEVAAASSGVMKERVTRQMLLAALTADQRGQLEELDSRFAELEGEASGIAARLEELEASRRFQNGGYFGVAHALLNAKEFIYVY